MESLPEDAILEFNPDTLDVVRRMYNLDKPGEMSNAVDIFEAWVQQQNHFMKKDFSRGYLERMIIAAKGSVERAKGRLDRLCTLRNLVPHFFGDFDVKTDFKDVEAGEIIYAPLPKLTKNNERVIFVRVRSKKMTTEAILNGFRFCLLLVEYMKEYDYAASYIFATDHRECNFTEMISKINLVDARNFFTLLVEGYGVRLSGIHIVTPNKFLDAFMAIMRQIMPEKISGRIRIHKSYDSVYEFADKEILPKEYGDGTEERSLDDIYAQWKEILSSEKQREHHRETIKACTDESKRQTDKFNEKYMGMPGTFRTLKVD
ncbi:uncharacterized protein LOC126376281 [Pectinophora gossypiella]|uniref:uncharacterized protein LOC126376281 n=1 Tax=Pectinophora gossypiella TaxID=13191 RepID=UPI00214F4DED|nr:uncharacterized protein LOC126376281 [Pectinophora gossypiella]